MQNAIRHVLAISMSIAVCLTSIPSSFAQPSFSTPKQKSYLSDVNDFIVNSGEPISLSLLNNTYRGKQFDISVDGLPEGATVEDGVFSWIPSDQQAGNYTVRFKVDTPRGVEERAVNIDILAPTSDISPKANMPAPTITAEKGEARSWEVGSFGVTDMTETQISGEDISATENVLQSSLDIPPGVMQETTVGDDSFTEPITPYVGEGVNYTSTVYIPTGNAVTVSAAQAPSKGGGTTTVVSSQEAASLPATKSKPAAKKKPDPTPNTPTLSDPGKANFIGQFLLEWSDELAIEYQIDESTDETFSTITNTFYSSDPSYMLTPTVHPSSDYYYYRVRAWSANHTLKNATSSDYSNTVKIGIDYERAVDIMAFPDVGVFTEVNGAPTNFDRTVIDPTAYTNPVIQLNYDLHNQAFAGLYFSRGDDIDISNMRSLNLRLRGEAGVNYPIRMVIELKYEGAIQGVVFVTTFDTTYTDLSFPFYCESEVIDEVVIYVEDDIYEQREGTIVLDEFFFSEQKYEPDIQPEIATIPGQKLNDAKLFDYTASRTAQYFYDEVIGVGHVKDTTETDYSSIAATGFGFAALAILAERYDPGDTYWNKVTPAQARARAEAILNDFLAMQEGQELNSEKYGVSGCFYHFIDENGERALESEVSLVDTALLIAGALVAGEYFGGEVKTKADLLYDTIDWTFFIDENSFQYYMGWKPEATRGYTTPKAGGYISSATFSTSTDEVLLISLLALGNHPDDERVRKSYFSYPRTTKTYTARSGDAEGTEYTVVNSYFGSLFTYVYAHCYFDFEMLGPDHTFFAPDAPYPASVDWWQNSVEAVKANRQFCIDESQNYPFSYHENSWGISAVQRPDGRYEGRYGAVPFDNGAGHDGVVSVYAPLSSMPFLKESDNEPLSKNEGFQVLSYFYDTYYGQLMNGPYGLYDSFDNEGNFSSIYLGIDQGCTLLMMENMRDAFIWNTFKTNEKIAAVLDLVFQDQFDFLDIKVRKQSDDSIVDMLGFGENPQATTLAQSDCYLEIEYNFENPAYRLVIYTDNGAVYAGTDDPAGLVGVDNPAYTVPIYWTVFDEIQPTGYTFSGDEVTEGVIQDLATFSIINPHSNEYQTLLDARTIVDGARNLAPYPSIERVTESSKLYMYFGCNFDGVRPQAYTTENLVIEIFVES